MMRRFAFFAPAAVLASVLAMAPVGLTQAASPQPPTVPKEPVTTLGPEPFTTAPDFTLKSLTGEPVKLSDFRGKVVLLNFWATWVGPCKILMPWLVELQTEYGPQGLQVVGVSLDDDATPVEIGEFAGTMRVNYPILMGDEKVATAYGGIPAMPATFFIGRDGKILDRIIGLKGKGEIVDAIKKALDPNSGTHSSATKSSGTRGQATSDPAPQAQK